MLVFLRSGKYRRMIVFLFYIGMEELFKYWFGCIVFNKLFMILYFDIDIDIVMFEFVVRGVC